MDVENWWDVIYGLPLDDGLKLNGLAAILSILKWSSTSHVLDNLMVECPDF